MKQILDRRLALAAAAAVVCLLVASIPAASASAANDGRQQAKARASVRQKIKRLSRRVTRLKRQVEREQGSPRPPAGRAGGDLAGFYPDPSIGTGAVDSAKVADRSLGGRDINRQTTIGLGNINQGLTRLNGASGLFAGLGGGHNIISTALDPFGVEVFEGTVSEGDTASLSVSGLSFGEQPTGRRVTVGLPFSPVAPDEARYESTITLPESFIAGNPPAGSARIYVRQASGLTQLVARFADGNIDVLAEEAP